LRCDGPWGKSPAVLFEEKLRPRVAVRLEETDDAVGPHVASRRQGGIDFRRMMSVVIDDPDVTDKPLGLEPALGPVEMAHGSGYLRKGKSAGIGYGRRRQGV